MQAIVKLQGGARLPWLLCFLLCLANVSLQFFVHGDALDNGVENRSSPSSGDSRDYVRRARQIAGAEPAGFAAAFGDGYRTPGYPLFLAAFQPLSHAPLRAARVAQVLLSASIILLVFLTLRNLLKGVPASGMKALGGAALVAAWPPLYHFSPILIAETCSLFGMALLLWTLSRPARGPLSWIAPSLILAVLVYLKPNHFLLLIPIGIFLGGKRALYCALLSLALIAPWSAFISIQNHRPVFLSTAADINLYLGTGVAQAAQDASTLPYRFAKEAGFVRLEGSEGDGEHAGRTARAIWREHPLRTSLYGVTKVLHGFGFSLRDVRDWAQASLLAVSVFFSIRLWRRRGRSRDEAAWPLLFWGLLLVTALQLFVYLPNQRLKTVLFDLPALLVLALGVFKTAPGRSGIKDESSRFSGKGPR